MIIELDTVEISRIIKDWVQKQYRTYNINVELNTNNAKVEVIMDEHNIGTSQSDIIAQHYQQHLRRGPNVQEPGPAENYGIGGWGVDTGRLETNLSGPGIGQSGLPL